MSSINGLTGQYINTLSNLSFEDDNNSLLYLRLDGSNKMENKIDMDGYKIVNLSNPLNSQDGVNKQFLDLQLLSYVLANNPVLFASLNMNNFRITSLASPTTLTDATNVFYVQSQNNLKLSLTGGTMTGILDMGNNKITNLGNPTNGTDVTNKNYVDTNFLELSGGTMTGDLNMGSKKITSLATPTNSNDGVNKSYVDTNFLELTGGTMTGNIDMGTKAVLLTNLPLSDTQASNKKYVDQQDNLKLSLTGGTMTGDLNMGTKKITNLATPTNSNDGVNKSYVDSNFLELCGGTMTGDLNMGAKKITSLATPTNSNDGVNKSYVDNKFLPLTGGTISSNLLCQNYVTIGNTAINSYPLEITNTAPNLVTSFTSGYTMTSGGTSSITPTLNSNVSLKTFGSIWTQARIVVSSDPRIKTDFQELEIKESLEIVDKITPFRYTMIESKKIELGFSAKKLQNLIPEAVDTHQNRLPSMMEMIDVKNNVIRTKKRIEAHQDDEIVLFQDDREIRTTILKKMSKNYIRVDLPDGEYLFYGHVVKDFLTLDYKQVNIHLLNVVKNLLFRVDCLETIIKKYI